MTLHDYALANQSLRQSAACYLTWASMTLVGSVRLRPAGVPTGREVVTGIGIDNRCGERAGEVKDVRASG